MSREQAFPKKNRIRKKKEFSGFSKNSRKLALKHLIAFVQSSGSEQARLGLTVSRFLGNAVKRNRFKRLSREFFRKNKKSFIGFDVLFIARNHKKEIADSKKYESELKDDFKQLLKRLAKCHH